MKSNVVWKVLAVACLFFASLSWAQANSSVGTNTTKQVSWQQTVTGTSTLVTNALMPHASKIVHVSLQTAPAGAAVHANANPTGTAATTDDQFAPAGGGEITFGMMHPETRFQDAVRVICSTSSCDLRVTITYVQ